MPNVLEQPNSADECDRRSDGEWDQLYRQSLTKPLLLAEIQYHCELLTKSIGESVAKLSKAEQCRYQSVLTSMREVDPYIDLDPPIGIDYERSVAINLADHLKILLDMK